MSSRILSFVLLLFLVLLTASSYAEGVKTLLPASSCPEGWKIDGNIKVFHEDNLYDHINGEAEMYIPYNFKVMATAAYNRGGKTADSIIVDVYQMGSVLDAFGIYSNYRGRDSSGFSIGIEGYADETLIMFYKGPFYVRITGLGKIGRDELQRCALLVESNIKGNPPPPKELKQLSVKGVIKGTEKYLAQSILGYPFFKRGLIAEADVKGTKASVFVINEGSPFDAKRVINDYRQHLMKEGIELQEIQRDGFSFLSGNEPLYKRVMIYQGNRHIVGIVRFDNDAEAVEVIKQIIRVLN